MNHLHPRDRASRILESREQIIRDVMFWNSHHPDQPQHDWEETRLIERPVGAATHGLPERLVLIPLMLTLLLAIPGAFANASPSGGTPDLGTTLTLQAWRTFGANFK